MINLFYDNKKIKVGVQVHGFNFPNGVTQHLTVALTAIEDRNVKPIGFRQNIQVTEAGEGFICNSLLEFTSATASFDFQRRLTISNKFNGQAFISIPDFERQILSEVVNFRVSATLFTADGLPNVGNIPILITTEFYYEPIRY